MTFEIENLKDGSIKDNYPQIEKEFRTEHVEGDSCIWISGRGHAYVEINTLEELMKLSDIVGTSLIIERADKIGSVIIFDDYYQ